MSDRRINNDNNGSRRKKSDKSNQRAGAEASQTNTNTKIAKVQPLDVLLGRESLNAWHEGTIRLLQDMDRRTEEYINSSGRATKTRIIREIYKAAKANGRFLTRSPSGDGYIEVSEKAAKEKISHMVRYRHLKDQKDSMPLPADFGNGTSTSSSSSSHAASAATGTSAVAGEPISVSANLGPNFANFNSFYWGMSRMDESTSSALGMPYTVNYTQVPMAPPLPREPPPPAAVFAADVPTGPMGFNNSEQSDRSTTDSSEGIFSDDELSAVLGDMFDS
eukprot:scaffold43535_cov168-Amphora_coffeaeformis.AAC.1